jgi:excisionase family DNA binding protein
MEDLLTIEETALYLRVSESTVRRMVKDGRIPATQIGRQWRIARAALEALVKGPAARGELEP